MACISVEEDVEGDVASRFTIRSGASCSWEACFLSAAAALRRAKWGADTRLRLGGRGSAARLLASGDSAPGGDNPGSEAGIERRNA
ncbi:MAG: hypothetical protein GYA33_07800 [Thermogutta sp.]|nr:hypothetical protein [Thermogutta sp.]